jgi:hypothetical protein
MPRLQAIYTTSIITNQIINTIILYYFLCTKNIICNLFRSRGPIVPEPFVPHLGERREREEREKGKGKGRKEKGGKKSQCRHSMHGRHSFSCFFIAVLYLSIAVFF